MPKCTDCKWCLRITDRYDTDYKTWYYCYRIDEGIKDEEAEADLECDLYEPNLRDDTSN